MANTRQFPLELSECRQAIEQYKQDVESGAIKKPCIPHFLGRIGASTQEYLEVINSPNDKNTQLSTELKKFGTWLEGEMIQHMGGPNNAQLIFLLKQGFSGYVYKDKQEIEANTTVVVNANFDPKFHGKPKKK